MKYIKNIILPLMVVFLTPYFVFAADQQEPRLITVTGDAEVRVVPDEVIITLGVETWDKDLTIAKSENDKRIQKIIDIAKKQNVEGKHIQTDYISIEPRYEHRHEHRNFIGYFVKKTIVITLKDTEKFENILSSTLEAGANYVHGVQFRTTELRKHRDQARSLAIKAAQVFLSKQQEKILKDQARSLAIKAAQEKANDLAKELDQKVGKPYKIQENQSGWGSHYNSWWGSRGRGGMYQNVIQNVAGSSESESSIALGQIKVTARITVSFELE